MNWPAKLFLPKMTISKNPTTDGGNTNGKRKAVSAMAFPLNLLFAIPFPMITPRIIANTPETAATSADNRTGDQKSVAI